MFSSPREVRLGDHSITHAFQEANGNLFQPTTHTSMFLFLALLADSSVMEEINNFPQRVRGDDTLEDFCDGELFKAHTLFSVDLMALQTIAFYDEVELCNPLGTHVKKHKLGIVLFALGNIHPKYRSTLRTIQLVLTATIENYGLHIISKPFIDDLKVRASDGIAFSMGAKEKVFRGVLLVF